MSWVRDIRDALIGPPVKSGKVLPPDVSQSFDKVDDRADLLTELARRLQGHDEKEAPPNGKY